jgi:PAS domain S-box-containing protein
MTVWDPTEARHEQLFSAAVESSDDAIITKSLDGIITGWNHAAEILFGFTSQEAIGESIDIIVPEELRSKVREILDHIRNGEKVDHHDTIRITKDGRRISVSLSVSPVKSRSGDIIGAAKVARDNDARIREQKALLESEQMAQAIIESSLDAFVQLDENGIILRWSSKAEAMFGWTREEAVGQNLRDLIIPKEIRSANLQRLTRFLSADP